jgi:hypothetical protein
MAINISTATPAALLAAFKKGIKDGHIVTWSCDDAGDFTHTPPQWQYKAWLRPVVYNGQLTLNILGQKSQQMSLEVYAVYHGRFIEAMIAHCRTLFTVAAGTSVPTTGDSVRIAA